VRAAVLLLAAAVAACGTDRTEVRARTSPPPSSAASPAAAAATFGKRCGAAEIDGAGIGALRIGAPVDSVRAHCTIVRDTVAPGIEGMPARTLNVVIAGDTVLAEIDSERVWRVQLLRPAFRTADSLGVGTPLSRLLRLPDARAFTGEGGLFVMSPARCGLSFELSENGGANYGGEWDAARLRRLPAGTVVKRVLIVGCTAR
jgi:hypothetical protein